MEETFSPILHRVNAALRYRAAHPTAPIQQAAEILTRYSQPPTELVQHSRASLADLIKSADVKKVPAKTKGRKRARDTDKPLSGLDIGALLGTEKRVKLTAANAIPEFRQLLATSEDPEIIQNASLQLANVIEDYVNDSVGDSGYGRAIESIRVFKEEMIELEEPDIYNTWMKKFKEKLLNGDLGEGRNEMWWRVRVNKLGLIHRNLSEVSTISEEDAKAVSCYCTLK
jgi:ATP-dependent DNA helicase 2 subunit 2